MDASINFWQGGVEQKIETADMYLYLLYQHADGDVMGNAAAAKANAAPNGVAPLDGFRELIAGARMNF